MFNTLKLGLLLGTSAVLLLACSDSSAPGSDADAGADSPSSAPTFERVDQLTIMDGLSGLYRDAGAGSPLGLIIPGSGPTDQNGNSRLGIVANTYGLLADGLEEEGISTLRIDKRGLFSSAAAGDPNEVSVDIYAEDYRNWAAKMSEDTGRDCLYLLGHSEGGLMALAAAAGDSAHICGLVLLAAPGRTMGDVLREQFRANPANEPIMDDAIRVIETLEAGDKIDVTGMHPALSRLFVADVQDFLISLFSVDPAELLEGLDIPVLILQGDRDVQISVADAERLAEHGGELAILPTVNHVLKVSPEDLAGNYATYTNPDLPLAETVVPTIAAFMKETAP